MDAQSLRNEIRNIISEVSEIDEIRDEATFAELGIDSMMAVEIVAEVERTYKITIPEEELVNLTNLEAVYAKVEAQLTESGTR